MTNHGGLAPLNYQRCDMERVKAELNELIRKELSKTDISREIAMRVLDKYFSYKPGWLRAYINRSNQNKSSWNPTCLIMDVQDMVQAQVAEQLEHESKGEEDQS